MNENQKVFVREYLKDFNGTRAYKVAYPECNEESARRLASRLLSKVDIQKAIRKQADKQLEEVEVDVAYIVNNIKEVTERCMQKSPVMYYDKVEKEWKQEKKIIYTSDGTRVEQDVWQFDASNSLKGLELLGKYKSIFKDNVDVSVKANKKFDEICSQLGGDGLDD